MSGRTAQISALLRTVAFGSLFVAGVLVYLPWALGVFRVRKDLGWDLLGGVPLVAGSYIALRCAFEFAWRGRGTPAPFDAPRRLVVEGMYRYVRNPMYWGAILVLVGQWALFGVGWATVEYIAIFAVAVHLFVIFYEEPTLRRKFGEEYEEYCRNVPRWAPRRTPWEKP